MDTARPVLDSTEKNNRLTRPNSPNSLDSNSNSLTAEHWCHTQVKIVKMRYIWTISNFSFCRDEMGDTVRSSIFSAGPNDKFKWCLRINPKGLDDDSRDYLSLYLLLVNSGAKAEARAKFRFSLLNSKKEETKAMESQRAYRFIQGKDWGFKKFIRRDVLMDEISGLLPNDQLTIACEISVVGETVSESGQINHQPISIPDSNLHDDIGYMFYKQLFTDVTLVIVGVNNDQTCVESSTEPVKEHLIPCISNDVQNKGPKSRKNDENVSEDVFGALSISSSVFQPSDDSDEDDKKSTGHRSPSSDVSNSSQSYSNQIKGHDFDVNSSQMLSSTNEQHTTSSLHYANADSNCDNKSYKSIREVTDMMESNLDDNNSNNVNNALSLSSNLSEEGEAKEKTQMLDHHHFIDDPSHNYKYGTSEDVGINNCVMATSTTIEESISTPNKKKSANNQNEISTSSSASAETMNSSKVNNCNHYDYHNQPSTSDAANTTQQVIQSTGVRPRVLKQFQAHKAVLAARSPVFAAMFEHRMEESRENRVEISDVDPETMAEVLRYIYTGRVQHLQKLAPELLAAADKYHLTRLKVMCEKALVEQLCIDNACITLGIADIYNAEQLKTHAMDFIIAHAVEICETEGFDKLTRLCPKLLNQCFRSLANQHGPLRCPLRKKPRQS